MTLPILDNILLHLLAKTRGKTIEEKLDNFFKTSFSLGNFTTLFGAVFALITVLPLPFTRLSESEQLDTELKLRCFVLAIFVGMFPELIEKDYNPLPICELEENIQTKIILTARIDEELVKQFYDKRELEELLTFSPHSTNKSHE